MSEGAMLEVDATKMVDRGSQEKSRTFDGVGVRIFPWQKMWLAVSGLAKVEAGKEKRRDDLRTGDALVGLIEERNRLRGPHKVSDRAQGQTDLAEAEKLDKRIEALRQQGVTQTVVSGERLADMQGGRTMSFQVNGDVFDEFMHFSVFEEQLRKELRSEVRPGVFNDGEFNFFHNRYTSVNQGLTFVVFNTGETRFLVRGQEDLPPLTLAIALVQAAFEQSSKELARYKVTPQQVVEAARALITLSEFREFITTKSTKIGGIIPRRVQVVDINACQDKAQRGQLATLLGTAKTQLMGVASGSGLLI